MGAGLLLGLQQRGLAWKAFSNGLSGTELVGNDVDLLDRVGHAVEVEVEPHVEEVLVVRRVELRRDECCRTAASRPAAQRPARGCRSA